MLSVVPEVVFPLTTATDVSIRRHSLRALFAMLREFAFYNEPFETYREVFSPYMDSIDFMRQQHDKGLLVVVVYNFCR